MCILRQIYSVMNAHYADPINLVNTFQLNDRRFTFVLSLQAILFLTLAQWQHPFNLSVFLFTLCKITKFNKTQKSTNEKTEIVREEEFLWKTKIQGPTIQRKLKNKFNFLKKKKITNFFYCPIDRIVFSAHIDNFSLCSETWTNVNMMWYRMKRFFTSTNCIELSADAFSWWL